ncbi:MAG: hypothetical protein LAO08_06245 [Acidobacteriia bacterium]|nr:hypothetical protein [Terriglobia bacterium]
MALFAPLGHAQSLNFYKNYFVTGDYAVAGVGLYGQGVNGVATGRINMSGVPAGADIVAAYLYWETVETTTAPSSFKGTFDKQAIVGAVLGNPQTPSCWSSGGTSPQVSVRVYRADVLRYLPIDSANSVRLVDGAHTVSLADSGGTGNGQAPHTAGASLVVIYRLLAPKAAPLKAVVIYDGDSTLAKKTAPITQTIAGFYDAVGDGNSFMTQIVGDGQPGFSATLSVNGSPITSTPFVGALGGRWDNYTFNVSNYIGKDASQLETQITTAGNQVCLSWGAIITSTDVMNSDGDGILDSWKTNTGGLTDPNGNPLPPLAYMGAKPGQEDIFIQMDWMNGADGHLHIPKLGALDMVAKAFIAHGIHLHFDVGSNYQTGTASPDEIVPAAYAKGGTPISETPPLVCTPSQTVTCSYSEPYAVLGWKKGFLAVKNGFPVLKFAPIFSHTRKDIFHEILMAHAMAGPFDANGKPTTTDPSSVSGVADRPGGDVMITLGLWNADDPPGCDPTTTCVNQTGTVLEQAGTIMHELGHNLGLSHGGVYRVPNCMADYPSVMNYLYQTHGLTDANGNEQVDYSYGLLPALYESMLSEVPFPLSAKYRTRYYGPAINLAPGQTTAKGHCDGTPLAGDSAVRLETSSPSGTPDWNNNGKTDAGTVSVDINFNGAIGDPTKDSVAPGKWFVDSNDWANLNLQQVGARLNVNGLSADVGQSDLGQSDLGQSDLGQSDLGQSDLGQSDLGQSDLGQSDLGQSDLGDVDYPNAISTIDATSASNPLSATNTTSRVTLNWGAPSPGQIRKYTIYRSNQATPLVAPILQGTVTGTPPLTTFADPVNDTNQADTGANCPSISTCYNTYYNYFITATDVNLTTSGQSNTVTGIVKHLWVTANSESLIYGTPLPASVLTPVIAGMDQSSAFTAAVSCASTTGPLPTYPSIGSYTIHCTGPNPADGAAGVDGVTYTDGTLTITARPITVTADPKTKIYGTADPALTYKITSGSLVSGDAFSGALTRAPGKNVGTYAILQGSLALSSNYSLTYVGANFTITPRSLTITAQTNTKVYDRTVSAKAIPVVSPPTATTGLVSPDTVTGLAEVYSTASIGQGKTLTVSAYTINDGNSGKNYTVTKIANTTGVITDADGDFD